MQVASFTPTEEDYVSASRAHYLAQWRSRRRITGVLMAIVLVTLAALALGWMVNGSVDRSLIWLALFYGGCLVVGIGLGAGVSVLLLPGKVRRMFAQQPAYREPMTVEWSNEAVVVESVLSRTRVAWEQLVRRRETRRYFLLYISDAVYLFVPKRALADGQSDDLRTKLGLA